MAAEHRLRSTGQTEAKTVLLAEPGVADALARPPRLSPGWTRLSSVTRYVRRFCITPRLEAVRRQEAVDGQAIDPWHLAAVLEGLRLRMDHALRIIDRGMILHAARHALHLHGWLTSPDFDQEGDIQRAEAALATFSRVTPLLAAALGANAWLGGGGERPPLRAALIRHWRRHRLLRDPVPLTGAGGTAPGHTVETPGSRCF